MALGGQRPKRARDFPQHVEGEDPKLRKPKTSDSLRPRAPPIENVGMPHQSSESGDVIDRLSKACSETWRKVTLWPLGLSISAIWRALIRLPDRSLHRHSDNAVDRPACYNISIEMHRILHRLKYEEEH
jgi:hypothetical protein